MKLTGITEDATYLAIGRAIVRMGERGNLVISDDEAVGHAHVLQARYKFVDEKDTAKFDQKVLSAYHYVSEGSMPVSATAAARFALENKLGTTPLHRDIADKRFKDDLGGKGSFA
ncbi:MULTISPECIES: hypothetical protein [Massilia]|jgi:hypothetical protein|uniref:Uncharacterized protein n=1 Tax=Massilia timonae CCUG 45783 TaxID=883126 RepID=K9DRN5_9BURK|nr:MULTISPECIES: hypothetical protein [Massilia]EKU81357.1 hypothetical protein HMPREF9710_03197 [Massilia timonae CCUG 45783]QYG01192.1 hypothetical protein KY496_23115 [Massilia sp. NP310]